MTAPAVLEITDEDRIELDVVDGSALQEPSPDLLAVSIIHDPADPSDVAGRETAALDADDVRALIQALEAILPTLRGGS